MTDTRHAQYEAYTRKRQEQRDNAALDLVGVAAYDDGGKAGYCDKHRKAYQRDRENAEGGHGGTSF